MRTRTTPIALVALSTLVALAACSTGESAVPGVEGSPDFAAPNGRDGGQPETAATGPSRTTATTTDSAIESAAATDEESPPSTDIVTESSAADPSSRPSSTASSTIDDVCASLANDGFETRSAALRESGVDLVDIGAACPDAYTRWSDATDIVSRMARFNAAPEPLSATDLVCDGGNFSLTITNNVDHPIGIHASMRLIGDDTDGPVGSTLQPLLIWSLEPGASSVLADEYLVNRGLDEELTCEVGITAFDASPGDADASLGETRVGELAVDDPAAWLPFLVAQGAAIIGSGDADLAAVIEDVRSIEYPRVVEFTQIGSADGPPPTGTISVCTASIEQPDDRHMSLVYFDEGADSSRLQHGLFRRGNDDQWRWLSSSVYFDSQEYWDCGTPSSQ